MFRVDGSHPGEGPRIWEHLLDALDTDGGAAGTQGRSAEAAGRGTGGHPESPDPDHLVRAITGGGPRLLLVDDLDRAGAEAVAFLGRLTPRLGAGSTALLATAAEPLGSVPEIRLHGLTYDRSQWAPTLAALEAVDPGRRVVAVDLPGHGDSPRRDTYRSQEVVAAVHAAVRDAGLDAPVMVGHSLGGVLATIYATTYPTLGVVNIDQPLLVGGFGDVLRDAEPALRGPGWETVWNSLLAGMHIGLLPPAAQEMVRTATTPRQDLLLGYWHEVMTVPAQTHREDRLRDLRKIGGSGTPYRYISGDEPNPAYRSWLESALPEVTITVLPGSGHFPHLARPAELAGILAA